MESSTIDRISLMLDRASYLADGLAQDETNASDPYTALAQLIDSALAKAESLRNAEDAA